MATLLSVSGCESCGKKNGVDPRRYLLQSAEAIFEVTDIEFLAKRRTQLEALTSGVVTRSAPGAEGNLSLNDGSALTSRKRNL